MKTSVRIVFIAIALLGMVCLSGCKKPEEPQKQTAQTKIAPEGGVYKLDNGVTLIVPSGAVSEETEVKVEYKDNLDGTTGSLPTDIQGLVRFLPEGLAFAKPIEVSMPLNQSVAENTTAIFYWSATDNTWYLTDNGRVEGDKVQFYVEHFSSYSSIPGEWSAIFFQMDAAVGNASDESAISAAVQGFLQNNLWSDMGFSEMRVPMRVEAGGNAVYLCAQTCGLYGFWASEQEGTTRQGGGRYKEQSSDNMVIHLSMSNAQATAHLRTETQVVANRTIEIYLNPCATQISGKAKDASIEKGKTTQVTITAHCDGSPLEEQLLQLSYSPELSCDVVNKKTDDNGQITITVKGESEGNGIIYVKATSALDADLVTETKIPVNVGGGEQWRITLDIAEHIYSSFAERHSQGGMFSQNFKYEGGEQSIDYAYTLVFDLTIASDGKVSGTASATNYPEKFHYNAPAFSQSGQYIEDGVIATESSSQTITSSPEFIDLTDVPLCGTCVLKNEKRQLTLFSGVTSMGVLTDHCFNQNTALKYGFFIPNVTVKSSLQNPWESRDDSHYYGRVACDSEEDKSLSILTLFVQISMNDFKEAETPFQTSLTIADDAIIIGGASFYLFSLDDLVGIYTVGPATWLGEGHQTCSGTLKIENLSK